MQNLSWLLVLKIAILIFTAQSAPVAEGGEFAPELHNHESGSFYEDGQAAQSGSTARPRQAHFVQLDSDRVQQVAVGRPAKFRCVVEDIGDHKVSCTCSNPRLFC